MEEDFVLMFGGTDCWRKIKMKYGSAEDWCELQGLSVILRHGNIISGFRAGLRLLILISNSDGGSVVTIFFCDGKMGRLEIRGGKSV